MENVGRGVADIISKILNKNSPLTKNIPGCKVVIVCGKGNNGGDGFVAARHLYNRGALLTVFLLGKKEEVKGDAGTNLEIALKMGIEVTELLNSKMLPRFKRSIKEADIVVDAIFGTGFKGDIAGLTEKVIESINALSPYIVAVDIPSGVDADDGSIKGVCIRANITATMALPKRGHFLFPGREHTGTLQIVDIGIPESAIEAEKVALSLLTEETISKLLPKRIPDGHKGSFGHILVLSGSVGLTGASALSSLAALRTGA